MGVEWIVMAALNAIVSRAAVATGTALKTILQIKAPANQRVKLKRFTIGFHGISNTAEPILVNLYRQSTAGTMSSATPAPMDEDTTEAIQTTAQHTATSEPTAGVIVGTWTVHPQTGVDIPTDIVLKGGGYLGLVVTAAAGVNCDASMEFEE